MFPFLFSSLALAVSNHTHTAVPVETIVYKEVPVEIIKYEDVEVEVPVEKIVTKEVVSNLNYKYWLFDVLLLCPHQVTLSSTIFLPFSARYMFVYTYGDMYTCIMYACACTFVFGY